MSKGISPLIAAVMLLAFVMAIGGLFSEWSGNLVTGQTSQTSDSQDKILDCSSRTIDVESLETGPNNNWVNLTLQADGGALGEITVNVYPSLQSGNLSLNMDGGINSTSIFVGGEQDRFVAASNNCRVSIERDLDY